MLFALDHDLVIRQISQSAETVFGKSADELIGFHADSIFGDAISAELRDLVTQDPLHRGPPRSLGPVSTAFAEYEAVIHRSAHLLIVELEPFLHRETGALSIGAPPTVVHALLDALRYGSSASELCEIAVERLFAAMAFGRVLAYRFDQNDDGEVLSERVRDGNRSYLGHWFPAADIPSQARALYVENRFRLISSASNATSALIPTLDPATGLPIDLTFAELRAVSPVHIEYMKNMGTEASMSISLVVRGRLWGMISCHDAGSQFLTHSEKAACQGVGRLLSLHLEAQLGSDEARRRLSLRKGLHRLLEAVMTSQGNPAALTNERLGLLAFVEAQGLAVVSGQTCELVGNTPSHMDVETLCTWLDAEPRAVFSSSNLSAEYPLAHAFGRTASGILAISTSTQPHHYLIWFRQELVSQITWAGEPVIKLALKGGNTPPLHPRTSFKSWVESRRGHSVGWDTAEIDAALELRNALLLEALRAAKEEAERANLAKNRFLAVLSHELRTPLSPILLAAQMLEMRATVPDNMVGLLPMIRRNVELEARLIDDLLDLTSIERGKLQIYRREADLSEIIDNVLEMLRGDFALKLVRLEVVHSAEHTTAFVDSARIQQVIWNLVRNALKFSPTGGHVTVQVVNIGAASIKINVIDDGIGIAAAALDEIFMPFQQADATITARFGGLGLGLSIARSLAELHGGTVNVASAGAGHGATFSVTLPLVTPTNPVDILPSRAILSAQPLHILLVEDSTDTRAALTVLLEASGHVVVAVSTVRHALVELRENCFDLLLCDLGLPDGRGHELARAAFGRVPAIALSGYGQGSDIAESLAAGFLAHVTKPFDIADLEQQMATIIAMRALPPAA